LHLHGGQAVSRTDKCHQSMRAPVPTGTVSLVAVLPTPVRNDGVCPYSAPLGMLRMRPFQIWYLSMKLNAVTDRHRRVVVSSRCRKALAIWRTPWFLAAS